MKAMIFLSRRADLSREAFADWWLNSHRPLAAQLPGLVRHTFNLLPDDAPFDAIVEQWFVSAQAAAACYDSPQGQAVAEDSKRHLEGRVRMLVEEHEFPQRPALDTLRAAPGE